MWLIVAECAEWLPPVLYVILLKFSVQSIPLKEKDESVRFVRTDPVPIPPPPDLTPPFTGFISTSPKVSINRMELRKLSQHSDHC